ncbi:MAG: fumarylacetoacetase [Betaproteobacteria bacterium]|nr:fumarylacetoacetase [Betaproteobacteria bacterium]
MTKFNETHDPGRRSWVASANRSGTDFPIQNLPFGVFRPRDGPARGGVAIGDCIVDLSAGLAAGLFSGMAAEAAQAASGPALNPIMALGNPHASALRARLSELLREDGAERKRVEAMASKLLVATADVTLEMPCEVAAYTDFFTSIFHATRGGRVRNPQEPLTPNFKHIPIGYSGRATSIRPSGVPFKRPLGQFLGERGVLRFGPEPRMDFELEVGALIARGNPLGTPIPLAAARDYIFGYCLFNDWSARAIQAWESVPAGPFLGKTFGSTMSPWLITGEALAPFHCPNFVRAPDDPKPLPYLFDKENEEEGGIDLKLEAYLVTPRMRAANAMPARISATNLTTLYWTFGQMLTHHASNGCNLLPGDLLGSGTTSGPTDESRACLAELSAYDAVDISLPNGETRRFLGDGDEVILRARAERAGAVTIGFGECRGRIDPAEPWPMA